MDTNYTTYFQCNEIYIDNSSCDVTENRDSNGDDLIFIDGTISCHNNNLRCPLWHIMMTTVDFKYLTCCFHFDGCTICCMWPWSSPNENPTVRQSSLGLQRTPPGTLTTTRPASVEEGIKNLRQIMSRLAMGLVHPRIAHYKTMRWKSFPHYLFFVW